MNSKKQKTTTQLADSVQNTYFERFNELTAEFKFHFASRLYSWKDAPQAAAKLRRMRSTFVPATHAGRLANLQNIKSDLAKEDLHKKYNNYGAREPYFKTHPQLLLLQQMLFMIRHWYCVYGVDERDLLFKIIPQKQIEEILHGLKQDPESLMMISTYAINTFYLYEKLYSKTGDYLDLDYIFNLKDKYDHKNKYDLQLLIYLYTHCILGETLFYYQPVEANQQIYDAMLAELEQIIKSSYTGINLDNKFEFLVCARLCGFETNLTQKIYDEALKSVNQDNFLVDTLNTNINAHKKSFVNSEHRNVLFIMSTSDPLYNQKPIS